jgi:hypothetical protein
MDIELIVKKMEIKYYKNLKKNLDRNNIQYDWLNHHLENLQNIYQNKFNDNVSITATENQDNSVAIGTSNNTTLGKIFNNEDFYKKPWSKLNPIHKVLKIKEFVNGLKFDSEKDRAILKDQLIELVHSKVLNKKDKVNYDDVNGKIISLPNLQCDNGNFFYKV